MDVLFEKFHQKLDWVNTGFIRSLIYEINWKARLIGIKGARGVGKTTILLQYIKTNLQSEIENTLYVSLDNIWFSENTLVSLADSFTKRGGKYLFLDEVHKYPNWSQEIKNIYDDYPQLKIVFTGSSLLEILNARADLSRRAVIYTMQGLSFREYLNMNLKTDFKIYSFEEILSGHQKISKEILSKVKPLKYFNPYLKHGYFPFYNELPELYYSKIEEVINLILEIELPLLRGMEVAYVLKIKQLLQIISQSVPFIPNISKLSDRIGLNRITLLHYLFYLQESRIIQLIYKDAAGITKLQKPDKIFLENTNFLYALSVENANQGNLRETFFVNQLKYNHKIEFAEMADFIIDNKYIFEIGGKDKGIKQINDQKNAFIVSDELEYGSANKIPLWLFGFLY